ncbi:peptidoglycan recognition protein family protein [Pseudorhodoplanes sp.]|uniref:peptidoglycan recognition protein family protein n=1 Tax=Pseudorhodoplanes sp. TaxID=1934341 RepID=UPI003D0A01FB
MLSLSLLAVGAITWAGLAQAIEAEPSDDTAPAVVGAAAPTSPPILSREKWRAKPALPGLKPQKIGGIILHHTAVRKNPRVSIENKMRNLQSFSQQPGKVSATHSKPAWPDVPYHFYVDFAGRIAEGRDVNFAGDTNTNYKPAGFVQVVVEGDFEKETPDPAQLAALRELLVWLSLRFDVPPQKITMHQNHAATSCPGRNFKAALPALLAQVEMRRRKAVNEFCAESLENRRTPICEETASLPRDRAGIAR